MYKILRFTILLQITFAFTGFGGKKVQVTFQMLEDFNKPTSLIDESRIFVNGMKGFFGIATLALIARPQISLSRDLSDDERALQQNQRPTQMDATVAYNGIAPDFDAVRKDIQTLIKERPEKGPTLVRLAWHSSGTYDKVSKTGGSFKGTMRLDEELAHGANAGLSTATMWLEPIYNKYNKATDLSYADLYTLAGVVAIETLGGPKGLIRWSPGRVDSINPKDVTPDGRLPEADLGSPEKTAEGLRKVFYRMGFGDREIVALSGAHALGRCHLLSSGYVGPWTPQPTVFSNLYFVLLKNLKWTPNPKAGKFQYQDPSGKLMMLPSDIVLIEDPKFKIYVDEYAKDQNLFFKDFAQAFSTLLSF